MYVRIPLELWHWMALPSFSPLKLLHLHISSHQMRDALRRGASPWAVISSGQGEEGLVLSCWHQHSKHGCEYLKLGWRCKTEM